MSDEDTYEGMLKRSWGEIPKKEVLPNGTWTLKLGNISFKPGKGDTNDCLMFVHRAVSPMEDVDEDAIAALGDDYDFGANKTFTRIWLEDATDWDKARQLLAKHGIETEEDEAIEDTFKRAKGALIYGYLKARTYKNSVGEMVTENEVTQFSPIEE